MDDKAEQIYKQALSFTKMFKRGFSKLIDKEDNELAYYCSSRPDLLEPTIVNCGFSIELYLKALFVNSGKDIKGHQLDKLFSKLDKSTQEAIMNQFTHCCGVAGCQHFVNQFSSLLKGNSDIFIDWRYSYEPSKSAIANPQFVIILAYALQKYCESLL